MAVVSWSFTSRTKHRRKILPHHFSILFLIAFQVIDTTGSMSDDIASVRDKIAARIINNPDITSLDPLYIVTEFNDPSYSLVALTSDVTQFQSAVNTLGAFGGGDCAEMSGSSK